MMRETRGGRENQEGKQGSPGRGYEENWKGQPTEGERDGGAGPREKEGEREGKGRRTGKLQEWGEGMGEGWDTRDS